MDNGKSRVEVKFNMTLRDEVWDEVLKTIARQDSFKISDLDFTESQRHTVRRVLKEMETLDWLRRDSPQAGIWRTGTRAQELNLHKYGVEA